jgi:serine/threonine protein kinase
MTSTLAGYTIGRTLGSGFSAKVKLGTASDGSEYAVKIFRLDNPDFNARAFQLLRDEVQSVQTLDHKHVVKYFEFNENAVWYKKSGE